MAASGELKRFLLRVEVVRLYRSCLRASRSVPPGSGRDGLVEKIQREFEQHKGVTDAYTIKYLLSDGRTRLKQLEEMLGMQR